jgi:hypothetical protein
VRGPEALGLELDLGGFNRGLPCEDVDGHAHACADLGLMYSLSSFSHWSLHSLMVEVRTVEVVRPTLAVRLILSDHCSSLQRITTFVPLLFVVARALCAAVIEGGGTPKTGALSARSMAARIL